MRADHGYVVRVHDFPVSGIGQDLHTPGVKEGHQAGLAGLGEVGARDYLPGPLELLDKLGHTGRRRRSRLVEFGPALQGGANLHRGLHPLGDSHPRNRSLHSTSLAEIRISSGDVDGAADVVHDAVQLVGQTSPVRTRCRLRKFEHEFTNRGDRLQRERQAT
jgi:hypothetical protein